jgi:SAM-dependent methyltransferase
LNIDYALSREKRPDFRYRLKRRTEEVSRAIALNAPSARRVVDLGTAEGRMLQEIRRGFPLSWVVGIDHSLPLLLFGRKMYPDLPLVCADIEILPFLKSQTFDLVIAAAVVEHLVSPRDMLRESFRVLRPGGVLIVTCPHPFWEKISAALGWISGDHHSVMTPKVLAELCRQERLDVGEQYGFMISPVGLWGEKRIEAVIRKIGLDRFLPNHLLVAKKHDRKSRLKDEQHKIPA